MDDINLITEFTASDTKPNSVTGNCSTLCSKRIPAACEGMYGEGKEVELDEGPNCGDVRNVVKGLSKRQKTYWRDSTPVRHFPSHFSPSGASAKSSSPQRLQPERKQASKRIGQPDVGVGVRLRWVPT